MKTRPPNLRYARIKGFGSSELSLPHCGNCAYFKPDGQKCMMFGGYQVRSDLVCDEYVKGKPGTKTA